MHICKLLHPTQCQTEYTFEFPDGMLAYNSVMLKVDAMEVGRRSECDHIHHRHPPPSTMHPPPPPPYGVFQRRTQGTLFKIR